MAALETIIAIIVTSKLEADRAAKADSGSVVRHRVSTLTESFSDCNSKNASVIRLAGIPFRLEIIFFAFGCNDRESDPFEAGGFDWAHNEKRSAIGDYPAGPLTGLSPAKGGGEAVETGGGAGGFVRHRVSNLMENFSDCNAKKHSRYD